MMYILLYYVYDMFLIKDYKVEVIIFFFCKRIEKYILVLWFYFCFNCYGLKKLFVNEFCKDGLEGKSFYL